MPERHRCTAASSRHSAAATFAWTASKDRAAATPHPAGTTPHQPSCRRPRANPRSWTEISLGARAHTTNSAATGAAVKRFALGPPAAPRGDRTPPPAQNHNDVGGDLTTPTSTKKTSGGHLTRRACTDKRNSPARCSSQATQLRLRGCSSDWRAAQRPSLAGDVDLGAAPAGRSD
jgi:hypothetical protein